MNAITKEHRMELARVSLWPLTSRAVRAAVLMIAGMSKERADDHLDSFTPEERTAIWAAASTLERDAQIVAQCAERFYVVRAH
ncbi:hypothetical protein [Duganella radicis]|uniref:Uncharacterized protein n=1 Tax=Duganella radicis TaxID=551988 RepID=A0A6L6PC87_9BURK|nr:hypothetical protein [Duganella radicis]MTV36269.1 hypothetical protein [Duganella radicis]